MKMNVLLLCTIKYPFGKTESFLEDELSILSEYFEKIIIVPSKNEIGEIRLMPNNCALEEELSHLKLQFSLKNVLEIIPSFFSVWLYSLLNEGFSVKYIRYFFGSLHHFFNDFAKYKFLKAIINRYQSADTNLIVYDYWLLNSSLSLIKLKKEGLIQKIFCRAHGFDLYEERHVHNFLPFLKYKGDNVDKIFTISKHGENYLNRKKIHNTKTSYLGIQIRNNGKPVNLKIENKPILVSCSGLIPVKRVNLIAQAIRLLNFPLTWIHFGNGELENEIKIIVDSMDETKTCYLPGYIENADIQAFYKKYEVDAFISASKSEGLPVSMMEAQAYGIPIIAPEINGIPEIVNSKTGILFNPKIDVSELAKLIEETSLNTNFDRQYIKAHFKDHFSAEINYNKFAKDLIELNSKD